MDISRNHAAMPFSLGGGSMVDGVLHVIRFVAPSLLEAGAGSSTYMGRGCRQGWSANHRQQLRLIAEPRPPALFQDADFAGLDKLKDAGAYRVA